VRTGSTPVNVRYAGDPNGQSITQPQFALPSQILNPRIFRLGMAFRF
jgi:hypothetical protein